MEGRLSEAAGRVNIFSKWQGLREVESKVGGTRSRWKAWNVLVPCHSDFKMMQDIDAIVRNIERMNREAVQAELLRFRGAFRMDFDEAFLAGLSLEKLRHILLAAYLKNTN